MKSNYYIRYGDQIFYLTIEEYRGHNISVISYEKIKEDGTIWNFDHIMDFASYKMCIRLDRSHTPDSLVSSKKYFYPIFITVFEQHGYLKVDDMLPVSRIKKSI